jgi:hypothetical protein
VVSQLDAINTINDLHRVKFENRHTLLCLFLWHNNIEGAMACMAALIEEDKKIDAHLEDFGFSLLLFIAKKQYHFVKDLFEQRHLQLKDRFKPIYYALMTLNEI